MSTPKTKKPQLLQAGANSIRRVIKNYTTKAPMLDCGSLFVSVVFVNICNVRYTKKNEKAPKPFEGLGG